MISPDNKCTGCGACVNCCPKDAIHFDLDKDGFYLAQIDESRCVHCGLCTRTCPQLKLPSNDHIVEPTCFACQAQDDVRFQSSSGGMFTVLAKHVLNQGGVVFGSAYDEHLVPRHIEISSPDELPKLQKSKYTQSDSGLTFRRVKGLLKEGITVLYVGVPCQIGGLYAYLGKEWPNLYTVDLLCSGTSPVGVYRRYLDETEEKFEKKLRSIDFRNKENGWCCGHSTLCFEDGTVLNQSFDPFMRLFITAGMKAHACNQCNYAEFPRYADITIGDFWNIEKYDPPLTDGKGTSLVTVNSSKGEALLQAAQQNYPLKLCQPVDFFFTQGSNWFNKDRPMTDNARRFYDLIPRHSIYESLNKTLNRRYDICCVGNWSGYNYGAHLTHYALYQALTDQGYDVLMLEKPNEPPFPPISSPGMFRKNPYAPYALSALYDTLEDMRELNERCHTFIVGSDMTWNFEKFGHSMDFYTLSFVSAENNKIAYATSFGYKEDHIPQEHLDRMSLTLSRMNHLSTREDFGVTLARKRFDIQIEQVLDPVFLCDKKYYLDMMSYAQQTVEQDYLFCYVLWPSKEKLALIHSIAESNHLQVVCVGDALKTGNDRIGELSFVSDVQVEDWLWLLYHSKMVIADSFHAYAFSVLFKKQVISIYKSARNSDRSNSLSRLLSLPSPLVMDNLQPGEFERLISNPEKLVSRFSIDYSILTPVLEAEISRSRKWLLDAINNPPQKRVPTREESLTELSLQNYTALKKQTRTMDRLRDDYRRENNDLHQVLDEQRQDAIRQQDKLNEVIAQLRDQIKNLEEYQQGKLNYRIACKLKGGILCLKQHGILYTVRRAEFHAKRWITIHVMRKR